MCLCGGRPPAILTGPFLWQLPATYGFDAERMDTFMRMLPRTSAEAAQLAQGHDDRLRRGALVEAREHVRYRHAFEVRHPSHFNEEFHAILREHRCGWLVADTAGRFPYAEVVTADFVYVRRHGSTERYASRYADDELDDWARRIRGWRKSGLDVYVYFDNDAKVHAPSDALRLIARVGR